MFCQRCKDFTTNNECNCKLYKYKHQIYTDGMWEEKYAKKPYDLVEQILRNINEDDPDTSGDNLLDEPIEIINDKGITEKWNGACELMLIYDCYIEKDNDS